MQDIIIVIILVVLIGFGLYKAWLQFSGKKTCCGGTKESIKPQKLSNIMGSYTVHIDGMHCDSCKNAVTKAFNKLDGTSAKVNLSKKFAEVSYSRELTHEEITKTIEKLGFKVTTIDADKRSS